MEKEKEITKESRKAGNILKELKKIKKDSRVAKTGRQKKILDEGIDRYKNKVKSERNKDQGKYYKEKDDMDGYSGA